jgi:hypothetical protein
MNPDEMQRAWNSPRNHPPTAEHQRLAEQFSRQMLRRRRFRAFWLVNTFAWLTVITLLAAWCLVTGRTRLAQEWGLFPLLLLPWGFALHFLRRHLHPGPPVAQGESAVADSLRAALASNQETRSHFKRIGILYLLMVPTLALAVRQLHGVGKVSDRELVSLACFLGGVLLLGGIGLALRYRLSLQPQQQRLQALLADLGEPTP